MLVSWRGHMRLVGDLLRQMGHACRCKLCAGLLGEIGQLHKLQELDVSSNRLQGKYMYV